MKVNRFDKLNARERYLVYLGITALSNFRQTGDWNLSANDAAARGKPLMPLDKAQMISLIQIEDMVTELTEAGLESEVPL